MSWSFFCFCFCFGVQKLNPPKQTWGRGSLRPARDCKARVHPAVSSVRRAPVPLSPNAVASRHDTAAATKRRPRPAFRSAHRSPGPLTPGGGSCQRLGMEGKGGGTRGESRGKKTEMRKKPGSHL